MPALPDRDGDARRAAVTAAMLSPRERAFTLAGVLIALLLAALDQTIIATAGPAIQRDLRIPASLYAWITTAYLVASTVMVPIYGKLSDSFGRKPILLVGVVLFLLGSLLCGVAPTALWLIAFRAVQGLGAASLFTTTFAVIGDLFPPAVRGRYMGLVGGAFGLASVVGPLLGGFITDTFGWHWVFFINLPLGAVALWFIVTRMPRLGAPEPGARARVDVIGAAWLVAGVVPLLIALSLGRARVAPGQGGFAWGSWQILTMLGVAAVALAAFVVTERRVANPIIQLRLFRDRTIGLGTAAMFVLGASFLFAVIFLPLFLVNVLGVSATRAGLTMMPLTLGVVAGSILSGQLVSRLGRYKPLMLGALALLLASFALMAFTLGPGETLTGMTLKMVLVGLGIGPSFPLYTLAVQNAAAPEDLGVVTAVSTFARSLGQVIGVAAFGSVFAAALTGALARSTGEVLAELAPAVRRHVVPALPTAETEAGGEEGGAGAIAFDTSVVKARIRVTAEPAVLAASLRAVDRLQRAYAESFTSAIAAMFRLALGVVLVAVAVTLLLPERGLRHHQAPAAPAME